jgi:hypothetical protein
MTVLVKNLEIKIEGAKVSFLYEYQKMILSVGNVMFLSAVRFK